MTRSMEMSGSGTVMRGQSRIPNGGGGMKQSRLELLQADYQKKLLREKEEKMLQLYEQNQQRALNRVNNRQGSGGGLSRGGSVREFFNERRALQGKGGAPPIQQHYTQYQKSPSGSAKTQHSTTSYSSATSHKTGTSYSSGYGNSRSAPEAYRNSAGRDRAKPLAPIGPRAGPVSPQNDHSRGRAPVPPIQQKPRLYQRKPSVGKSDTDRNGNRAYRGQMNQRQNVDNTGYDSDGSPPPNHSTGKQQQRLAQVQRGGNHMSSGQNSPQKLTDFQKWQLEQNQAREERLKRKKQQYHSSSGASDASDRDEQDSGVDVNEEIRRRQEELEARLQVEQAELQRIQTQRQQKEEKERQKKARQERAERERQKRLEEQRERQRQAEEERQRLQEERRQAEERRQEEEEERRRASRASRQSRTNRQTDDEYSTTPRYGHQTHQKSPVKTHRTQRPDHRQERQRQRSPSPVINDEELFVPGPSVDIYAQAANDADAYGQKVEMAPCRICGRRFAKDRLAKHQNACKSVAKPRKVFDPVKMRTEGTEAAKYVNTKQSKRQPPPSTKKSNWRAQHESFIQSIRYAKKMTEYEAAGVKLSDLPPPPPSDTSDYVQCPHCNRRFNAGVAERHIPKCVNIKAKPRPPPNRRR